MGAFVHRVHTGSDGAAGCSLNKSQFKGAAVRPLRVAVTGSSGFIGGHLACLLAKQGFAVTALVRRAVSTERLNAAGVEVISAPNLTVPKGVDAVVHAAATSPGPGVAAMQLVADNIDLSRSLIEQARRMGVSCFVFLSSMSVYGEIDAPSVEETTPQVNLDLYGMTKRVGEALLEQHGDAMTGLAIRLPAVLGRGAARHWLAEAARRLVTHEDVPVFHPAARFNNAIHVNDLSKLIGHAISSASGGYEVVNVASSGYLSVLNAVEVLRRALGSKSRVHEISPRRPSFTISIARATKHLDFRPMAISEALALYGHDLAESVQATQQGQ